MPRAASSPPPTRPNKRPKTPAAMRDISEVTMAESPLLVTARDAIASNHVDLAKVSMTQPLAPFRAADGALYFVSLSSLQFLDWTIVTVIPEKDFLGNIDRNTQRLVYALIVFTLIMLGVAILLADRLIGRPLIRDRRASFTISRSSASTRSSTCRLVAEGAGQSVGGADPDGAGSDLVQEIPADGTGAHPGLPGHRGPARRRAADADGLLLRSCRVHFAVGAAGPRHRAGADRVSRAPPPMPSSTRAAPSTNSSAMR